MSCHCQYELSVEMWEIWTLIVTLVISYIYSDCFDCIFSLMFYALDSTLCITAFHSTLCVPVFH